MTKKLKALTLVALAGAFVLAIATGASAQTISDMDLPGMGGGGLEAPAIGTLGETEHGPVVEELLDLPALNAGVDAEGRVIMDLPGLKLVSEEGFFGPGEGPEAPEGPRAAPDRLPTTGANVGDIAALGLAALSGGGVLLRRLKLAIAS